MFSLIITIISIALVAVLAVATIYYGGTAFTEGQKRAKASEISAKGQQVMAATMLYHQSKLVWPATPEDLVTEGYLKSIPDVVVATNDGPGNPLVSTAHAESSAVQWSFLSATAKHLLVEGTTMPVPEDVCREVNKQQSGFDGVLTTLDDSVPIQCVETATADEFMVVFLNPEQVAPGSTDDPAPQVVIDGTYSNVCHDFLASGKVADCEDGVISDNRDSGGGGEGEGSGGGGGGGLNEAEISGSLSLSCTSDNASYIECRLQNDGNVPVSYQGFAMTNTGVPYIQYGPAVMTSPSCFGFTADTNGIMASHLITDTRITSGDSVFQAGSIGLVLPPEQSCTVRLTGEIMAIQRVSVIASRWGSMATAPVVNNWALPNNQQLDQFVYFGVTRDVNGWSGNRNLSDIDATWPGAIPGGQNPPPDSFELEGADPDAW